ncbi:hypothetical protein [Nannocystis pusilla]|uniref:Uncharacterized protein n=1 Tax=Nannocystis pusilla TaxID=889268 RepID=A0ABS7U0A1_9BACT|nr:hypothetical protein [Nannocystis pusilla]MBZ5713952.1 hypothetical protein [Nannocystis pusilla]
MNRDFVLRLSGVRYRCTPQFLPVDEFDPLARLFLEVLKYETNVSRLVRAFGLEPRVVEDVLGDLVRRNRARLVVQNGVKELRLVSESSPIVVHRAGEAFDVWQDSATGIVLPADLVDHLESGGGGASHELTGLVPLVDSFLQAPDAQLIECLLRCDSQLMERRQSFSLLDRLTDRYRVRPQTICVPGSEAQLQDQVIPQLTADGIPAWVTRVWSVSLRRIAFSRGNEMAFHLAATTDAEGVRLVSRWRARAHLDAWRDAVDAFLQQLPPPMSGFELRTVREKQAPLAGHLLSVAHVELLEHARADRDMRWIAPVLDRSHDWVVVVVPWEGAITGVHELLDERARADKPVPSNLLLIVPPTVRARLDGLDSELQRVVGPTRFVSVLVREWPHGGPAVVLGDWSEIRLRHAPQTHTLRMTGANLANEFLGILQALPDTHQQGHEHELSRELLRRLRVRRDTMRSHEEARLGEGPDARPIIVAIDGLRAFTERLVNAVVDPELLMRKQIEELQTVDSHKIDRSRPLVEQLPFLGEERDELAYNLSLTPASPWALWTRLGASDLLPTLAAVLTEPNRRPVEGQILILGSRLDEDLLTSEITAVIAHAVEVRGWQVTLVCSSGSGSTREAAEKARTTLKALVPSPRLRVLLPYQPVPLHALVMDDAVFLCFSDWLAVAACSEASGLHFGLAIESYPLAKRLWSWVQE